MKLTPYNLYKGIRYLKNYGWKEFVIRLKEKNEPQNISYQKWYQSHCATSEEIARQRKEIIKWKNVPKISVLMPINQISEEYFRQTLESVQEQSLDNWELCIIDLTQTPFEENKIEAIASSYASCDERIKYKHVEHGERTKEKIACIFAGISGDYIALVRQGDLLAPNAFYEVAMAVCSPKRIRQSGIHWESYLEKLEKNTIFQAKECGIPEFIYTDEDKIKADTSEHCEPYFKPDFSIDLLRSYNYISHLCVIRKTLFEDVGMFVGEFGAEQEYDFIFKCVEKAKRIVHIPKILYHCRMQGELYLENQNRNEYDSNNGRKVVEAHLKRMNVLAEVKQTENVGVYRIKYKSKGTPIVSILIPNKDEVEALKKCLDSIVKTTYSNLEIIVIENNSILEETFAFYKKLETDGMTNAKGENISVKVVTWKIKGSFNYSAINNYGASFAKGEYLVLLNNDVEILTADWLEEMLGICQRPEVAIVGARLFYPDDSIQHAGIVVGIGGHARGVAANMLTGFQRIHEGYLHKATIQANYSAVTAAFMMIRKSVFDEVGTFTEQLAVAFNDVDLCLKARRLGYEIVYNPYVEAYHYESKSRGQEDSEEKVRRFQTEIEYMRTEWNDILRYGDPYYNPNFSRVKNDYSLNGMDL